MNAYFICTDQQVQTFCYTLILCLTKLGSNFVPQWTRQTMHWNKPQSRIIASVGGFNIFWMFYIYNNKEFL